MYTGMKEKRREDGIKKAYQTQCLAFGDGENYIKYEKNPVLGEKDVPEGFSIHDFRDPKIGRRPDGGYACIIGNRSDDKSGAILLYESEDAIHWHFRSILDRCYNEYGKMWECPDLFELDDRHVLLVSPQDMCQAGLEFHNGNGTVCLIGSYDEETKRFVPEHDQAIDYGIDFYAPQTILTPDGRRVMIGWMQNWDTCKSTGGYEERPWFGQMSLPRELSIRNGRLYQQPVRELSLYRGKKVEYHDVHLSGETVLEGIEGRVVELDIRIRPEDAANPYHKFSLLFAQNEKHHSLLSFRPYESLLKIDRKFSGSRRAFIHQRRCQVADHGGEIHLHVILDRFSVEAFINDGEQVMTATILTDTDARGISFAADGHVIMDVTKYSLFSEE
jgi:beta-fructofuranosidase